MSLTMTMVILELVQALVLEPSRVLELPGKWVEGVLVGLVQEWVCQAQKDLS